MVSATLPFTSMLALVFTTTCSIQKGQRARQSGTSTRLTKRSGDWRALGAPLNRARARETFRPSAIHTFLPLPFLPNATFRLSHNLIQTLHLHHKIEQRIFINYIMAPRLREDGGIQLVIGSSSPPASPVEPLALGVRHEPPRPPRKLKLRRKYSSVMFSTRNRIHRIPGRHQLSREESEALYMSRAELGQIRNEIISLVRSAMTQDPQEAEGFDFSRLRGLESLIPQVAHQRKRRMYNAIQTVLHQQRQQQRILEEIVSSSPSPSFSQASALSNTSDEVLAHIYRQLAAKSARMARDRGLQDQEASLQSWKEASPVATVMERS